MQSVGSPPCNSYPTVGSIVHAGLSAVRSPTEESAISTVFYQGCQRNAEVSETSPQADLRFARPILCGPLRFYAKYQRDCWDCHHRPHLLLWNFLLVYRNDTHQGLPVAIQDPLLASNILLDSDVPTIFRQSQMASAQEI